MPVPFQEVPSNILVPLFWAEIQPAQAPLNASLRMLLLGHMNKTGSNPGTGLEGVPYILSDERAETLFGQGSMLSTMYKFARQNAPFIEIWGMAIVADAGTAAAGSIEVSSAPTRNETLTIQVSGRPISVRVNATDTVDALATRLAGQINKARVGVRASITTPTDLVNLTARWDGTSGNAIRVDTTFFGAENSAANRLLTVVQPTGGTGAGDLSAALASLGDQQFDVIVLGYGLSSHLDLLEDFLDGQSGRWSPIQQLYGHAITATTDDFANAITLGAARNDPHVSVIPQNGSPNPPWEWAAAIGAQMAKHWAAPPEISRPLQGIELVGIQPPKNMSLWHDISERQSLLEAGISTWTVDASRKVRIERLVTTYKTNASGNPDASWRDAVTMFQTMFFVRYMRAQITGTYPRAALTDEDSGIPGFASPGQIKDTLVHGYKALAALGLVENVDLFSQALVVERHALEANRVDILARPDLVNQLRIVATLVETHLQLVDADPSIFSTV